MGRTISPVIQRQLENLDKDAESRKMAMTVLKSYVKDLDSKAIPYFVAQVSETKDPSPSSVEHTISLYEVLARVHGSKIVPQIDNIMSTIINTLTSSAGSFPLQQACSKVVPAIARYAIDPSTPEDKKKEIIQFLCKPLSDSLLGSQESLAFGAALCLKALVDSDNWRFASDEIVNEVCLRVAGALEEKPTQTNSHMGLAMALAKHNSLIVEAYARSLIRSGLRILNVGVVENNSQKRLSAIQMVNYLMKCLDPRSIFSELGFVIEELEKCHSDQMAFVSGAAFEALQTASALASDKGSRIEKDPSSVMGSNFRRKDYGRRKNLLNGRETSPVSTSPESQTADSFTEYEFFTESPMSTGQISCNFRYDGRSINRKLWKNENGGVDLSLKNGLFSDSGVGNNGSKIYFERSENCENGDYEEDDLGVFSGFVRTTRNSHRTDTPSPQSVSKCFTGALDIRGLGTYMSFTRDSKLFFMFQRRHSQLNLDGINIFTTPRKLFHSLQDQSDVNSDYSENQGRRMRTPASSPIRNFDGVNISRNLNYEVNDNDQSSEVGDSGINGSESVSSTGDNVADVTDGMVMHEVIPNDKVGTQSSNLQPKFRKGTFNLVYSLLLILLAVIISAVFINYQEEESRFVPT
ncbi:hypothetical protein GIB67_010037 [Kingdonia uniflora]|uniref:TORTIFOLIA1/SINE1-2 N-terminal domain-containing protein n=1 Tax=Kingdonia uniflora TaxID=39325 RepID=A0A7J7KV76_9MAGN|nr:hypothetical protein GIB67_010037 [Kingdonia uniflora]